MNINDGTLCRTESQKPGPSGWFHRFESTVKSEYDSATRVMDSEYERVKGGLQAQYQSASRFLKADYEGARCLYQAYLLSSELAPAAILQETGYELTSLLKGLLPGLLQMMAIVGATTFIGAGVGGAIGFFFGGVGAAPGAVVGADLGFDLGMAILTWIGLAFLVVAIAQGFGEMLGALRNGVEWAWAAGKLTGPDEEKQVNRAAKELARAAGILVRLILEGIVAYLLKKAAFSSTRGAMATAQTIGKAGTQAAAEETVASLVGRLRASRLGSGFADWVESNWRDLMENPKLKPKVPATEIAPSLEPAPKEKPKQPQQKMPAEKTPEPPPRPRVVPDNWKEIESKKGGGKVYINPDNPHERVRSMPGNANSPNPAQQQPYVKYQKDGKFYDEQGNEVRGDTSDSHIPAKNFKYPPGK